MGDFGFELIPELQGPLRAGYTGTVGPFGEVRVLAPYSGPGEEPPRRATVTGDGFPDAVFSGGAANRPSLDGGMLKIDEVAVDLELKVKGVRKGSRWLEIRHQGHAYTYEAAGWTARLRRDGLDVTTGRGRYIPEVGGTRVGRVEGDATATDLALALVLEEVDTSVLTTSGALFAIPLRFLFGRQRDEGSPE